MLVSPFEGLPALNLKKVQNKDHPNIHAIQLISSLIRLMTFSGGHDGRTS